jgi:hypothetical protein
MITAIVAIAFIMLLSVLGGSIYLNYKLGKTMLIIQDKIEISLDELDQIYGRISKILDIPVFFDSVEVRQVIADIDNARNVVLKIADSLSNVTKDEDDTQEEN